MYKKKIGMEKEYVAALDLGASKMRVATASMKIRSETSNYQFIHPEGTIRRGLIVNRDRAAEKLRILTGKIPQLKKIYVGVGGQALHSKEIIIRKELRGEEVSQTVINEIENECAAYSDPSFALFEYLSPEYVIDGRPELYPEGAKGEILEAKCLMILGHPSLKNDIEILASKANLEIATIEVAPRATAEAVLTAKEKESGCALVEWGASLTYLSIYKDGVLRYLVTIPLGGNAITHDISTVLNLSEAGAENLKKNEGNALASNDDNPLHQVIEARAIEIIANIVHQIEQSGYETSVNAIVMTGGSSLLQNLDHLLEQKSGKTVRRITDNPEQSCIRGLLKIGKENCAGEPEFVPSSSSDTKSEPLKSESAQQVKKTKWGTKITGKIGGFVNDLFETQ